MRTTITLLLLFIGLLSYGQNYELVINQPTKGVALALNDYDAEKDTVVVFNSLNQMPSFFTLAEKKNNLVVNLKNVGVKAVGEYRIAVLENPGRNVKKEYPLKVSTPKPTIKAFYCKDMGKWFLNNIYEVRWDNTSNFLTLVIEGKNFCIEDANNNTSGRIFDWVGGDPNIAFDIVDQYDSLLVLKLNLSKLTRTGNFSLRLVNFDNVESDVIPISIVPQNPANFHASESSGGVRNGDVPKVESIRWINKDEELAKLMKGSIYATGKEQEYFLELNFEYNYQPTDNDFTVFGVPLRDPMGGRKKYTYEVTLPATLAVGDQPNLTYSGKAVTIKSGQGEDRVLNYNRPAEMPGFITVFPDDRESLKFDYYSNIGQSVSAPIKAGKTKLKFRVHNYKSYHMGAQNLTIICTLKNLHGATKVSNSDKQVNNDAIQQKAITLAEGDSTEFTVDFNTLKIASWNMVDISVTYNKNVYSVQYLQNDPGKVMTILYTSTSKVKFTYGLGIPTSAMVKYDFNKKDVVWSPFIAGLDFGFDWIDKFGASKGRGMGVELGFFQFLNIGDNATESFSFSVIPFYKIILGYKKKADLIVPLQIGVGAVPEWRHGVNYWNLAVMFQLRFDGIVNRVER